ncbi:hypothetical protein EU805_08000 [Salipiger sp. IMCC34102]|uniref:two pore domain potassium channel family protein n=1 Tax=Salipiger sp. IMCC34102 TaxID=2510647 RepID=UPI00101D9872|nr:two pore domain potassium channel family protein [Salipiger sp. IMCC34102]RYH02556.1 hypothetical protein EU805_08000 [Salipiger sp. IMCC34102]
MLDIFLTVLDANGLSMISSRIYRGFWWVWRHFSLLLPPIARHQMLALGAPLMIPVMIFIWLIGIVVGFTLIYYGGLLPGNLSHVVSGEHSRPELPDAFRLSVVSISTIGFVEISPSNMPYSLTVAFEAILGNLILTLVLTYFLSVHGAVLSYNVFVAYLRARIPRSGEPIDALKRHFDKGEARELEPWLDRLDSGLSALHEGLRRYPILYYFRPLHIERGLPDTLSALRRVVTGLNWGLPGDHPARRSANLGALEATLEDLIEDLQDRYVPIHRRTVIAPMSARAFATACASRRALRDPWLDEFLAECRAVQIATGVEDTDDVEQLYDRYLSWLPITLRLHDFKRAVRDDLGYSERVRPGRRSVWAVLASGPRERPQSLQSTSSESAEQ